MKGMVLAAGIGSRLRPLTETMPKSMVEVGGRPLIDYALDTLARSGITDVIVNLHHFGDTIRSYLGDGHARGLRIEYSEEDPLLGSGGGILKARALLGDEDFATLNADTIVDVDLAAVAAEHTRRGAIATMVLRKDPKMESYGLIRTGTDGRVVKFLDTPARDADPSVPGEAYMYTGAQILSPRVFDYMPDAGVFSITERTYPAMLRAGETVLGHPFEGRWITVGTHAELAAATAALSGGGVDSP